jgi:CubicO group peptidase (beta-lactamase class C family)
MMGIAVDQKKMTWETPVCNVLKSFKLGDEMLSRQLTAKLAVSASTGMPRRDFDFIFRYSDITPEDRLKQMQEMKPTTALGETFQYSNLLFMTGGYMAAHAYAPSLSLQEAYAQCLDELILKPLEMNQSTLSIDAAIAKGAAFPHSLNIEGELSEIPVAIEKSCASIAPSGALWSTVNDMAQYLLLELNHGVRHGKQIISQENLFERRKPGIKMSDKASYGLGLIVSDEHGLQSISHGGGTLGFASELCFYPEKEIGLVMMTNSRYGHAFLYAVKQKFLELTFGAKPRAETAIKMGLSQQLEMVRKIKQDVSVLAQDMQWIKEYLGEYMNRHLGYARITETQSGFTIVCAEWQSRLAVETDQKGKHYLVLIDPPFPGLLKLQATECGELVLDAGQEQYRFTKKEKCSLEQQPLTSLLIAKKQLDASVKANSEYQRETEKHEKHSSSKKYFK